MKADSSKVCSETEHRTGMASLLEEKRAICARVTARPPAYSMPKTQRKRLKQAGGQDFALKRSKKVPSFGENSAFFESYLSKAQAIEVVEMQGSKIQRNADWSSHLSDHRLGRERERELDRLCRLLRRAAELDVSTCCHDIRTLLLTRDNSEEMRLRIHTPPSLQGQIYSLSSSLRMSSQKVIGHFRTFPTAVSPLRRLIKAGKSASLQPIKGMLGMVLQLTDWARAFKSHQIPDVAEIWGALLSLVGHSRVAKTKAHKMLSSAAMVLMRISLKSLVSFWGLSHPSSLQPLMLSLLEVNLITWQPLAQLTLSLQAFRELGFTDSEIRSETSSSTGGWMAEPNSESADVLAQALTGARIISCLRRSTNSTLKRESCFRIPIPRTLSSKQHRCNLNPRVQGNVSIFNIFPAWTPKHEPSVSPDMRGDTAHVPQFRSNSSAITKWCRNVMGILFSQPAVSKFKAKFTSLTSTKNPPFSGKCGNSLANFVSYMRHNLETSDLCTPEGYHITRVAVKLSATFERLVREKNFNSSLITSYSGFCAVCGKDEASSSSQLVRCDRCSAYYHTVCSKRPLRKDSEKDAYWFCPICDSLVMGGAVGTIDRMISNVSMIYNVPCIIEHVLIPGCNSLLMIPQLILKRKDKRYLAMTYDEVVMTENDSSDSVRSLQLTRWLSLDHKDRVLEANNKAMHSKDTKQLFGSIRALSFDCTWNLQDWVAILSSLLIYAASATKVNACGVDCQADCDMNVRTKRYFLTCEGQNTENECHATSLAAERSSLEYPSGSMRKQRELILAAEVIDNLASLVEPDRTRKQLYKHVHTRILQDLLVIDQFPSLPGSVVSRVQLESSCTWCGGDLAYLQSAFVYSRNDFYMAPRSIGKLPNWAMAHEFCSSCLAKQRSGKLKHRRRQAIAARDRELKCTAVGRTPSLGLDFQGRIYWYFAHQRNMLAVKLPDNNETGGRFPESKQDGEWLCFSTVPSIAQVMQYLIEECDGEMDMLLTRMIFAFPEACMLLEPDLALPCMYSDDWAWLEKSISSSASELLTPSSEGLPQAYFDINDDIFVRVNELIWTGTVTKANAGEAELCYYVRRKCWNSTFDDWMSYEQSLGHSVIANSTQSNLYRSNIYRFFKYSPKLVSDYLDLVASTFIMKPFRIQARLPPSLLLNPTIVTPLYQIIPIALLTLCAALPIGSATPEDIRCIQICAENYARYGQVSALELTQLVLFLEDAINTSWVKPSWSAVRAKLPTRTHCLENPSLCRVALLIWILDRGLIYNKVVTHDGVYVLA